MLKRVSDRGAPILGATLLFALILLGTAAHAGSWDQHVDDDSDEIDITFGNIVTSVVAGLEGSGGAGKSGGPDVQGAGSTKKERKPSRYRDNWIDRKSVLGGCETRGGSEGVNHVCAVDENSCEAGDVTPLRYSTFGGDVTVDPRSYQTVRQSEGQTQSGTRFDRKTGETSDLGARCSMPGETTPAVGGAPADAPPEDEPKVVTVTQKDFAKLPVKAATAHAGPEQGWLPANMDLVLYADSEPQVLETELLDTPVRIRATPVEYRWDLGDGNVIVTDDPGEPWPSKDVSATYAYEGWYDVTLKTTYEGQFSVDGGEWQDIDGTVEIASDPQEVYSKSLESRLVNPDRPHDEEKDPFIPERSSGTEGPKDPKATTKEI
jgi:hypothetical protein